MKTQYADSQDRIAEFLAGGGQVTKCPTKAARDAGGKEFAHTKQTIKDKRKEGTL